MESLSLGMLQVEAIGEGASGLRVMLIYGVVWAPCQSVSHGQLGGAPALHPAQAPGSRPPVHLPAAPAPQSPMNPTVPTLQMRTLRLRQVLD